MTSLWTREAATEIGAALEHMAAAGQTPGGVAIAGDAEGAEAAATGTTTPCGAPVWPTTFYDIASLTKVAATWPLTGLAVTRGLLDLDAPMRAYFPHGPFSADEVTARQILTHTSGLMPSTRLDRYLGAEQDITEAILSEPLDQPGAYRYINRGFILLGLLLERLHAQPLDRLLGDYTIGVQADRIMYGPLCRTPAVAPTERRLNGSHPVCGTVHDESAALLGGIAGHAGVFATAEGLADYARTLLGEHGAASDFGAYIRASWQPTVRVDETTHRGLAWLVSDTGLVHHHGFTGTSLYLHPPTGRYLVLLTNAIHYGRERLGLSELRKVARKLFG